MQHRQHLSFPTVHCSALSHISLLHLSATIAGVAEPQAPACHSAGPVSNQRNLIPCQRLDLPASNLKDLEHPLVVQASAIAVPHPEKLNGGIGKAVNKKKTGWGGEDAYFYTYGQ